MKNNIVFISIIGLITIVFKTKIGPFQCITQKINAKRKKSSYIINFKKNISCTKGTFITKNTDLSFLMYQEYFEVFLGLWKSIKN
jgi:hypothetical protein